MFYKLLRLTIAKAQSRPRPRLSASSIHSMACASRRRAFRNGPASTTAERGDQLDDSRLIRCVIASYGHHRLNAVKERIGHIAETGGIECFEYRGACGPCLYLLAGRTVVTDF